MSVVDASIVARFVLKEEGWRSAAGHLRDAATVDHAVKEVANSVWKALRRGLIGESDAERKFEALMALVEKNLRLVDELELLPGAFRLAIEEGVTVYDALYVELARREGVPLVTGDSSQAEAAGRAGVEVLLL